MKAFFDSEIMVLVVILHNYWCFGCFRQCRPFIGVLVVFDNVGLPKYLSHTAKQTMYAFYWCFGLLCLFYKFIGVLVVCMVLVLVVFDSVGLIIVCLHGYGSSTIILLFCKFMGSILLMPCLYCK